MRYEELRALIAQRTRKLRDAKEWNQRQAEKATGVAQKTISNIENTEASIQLDTLVLLAQGFGMEVWELLKPSLEDEINDHGATYDVDPRPKIRREGAPGLRELAADEKTAQALTITPAEWRTLAAVGEVLPPTVDKAGFVQLLFTLRTITR